MVESVAGGFASAMPSPAGRLFEPPLSAVGPLFRSRLDRIHAARSPISLDINTRPTNRVLGGYYKTRRLVRVYSHDRELGRRPLEELFDTFLHEVAHHLEYTEPDTFQGRECGRVPGRMHSRLFWRILGELKGRWADLQRRAERRAGAGRRGSPPGPRREDRTAYLPRPSDLILAATSARPASALVLTFLSISLITPSLSM